MFLSRESRRGEREGVVAFRGKSPRSRGSRLDRGIVWPHRAAASHRSCPLTCSSMEPESEVAALRAEVAKLRRQLSAKNRDVAVWRELALREKCCLTALPEDVLQHIVLRIQLAHHIARAAPTCKVVSVAVRNAIKARKFSTEVVTLAGHTDWVRGVAAAAPT